MKKLLVGACAALAIPALAMSGATTASAASSCAGPGYLCSYDYQSGQYASVKANNVFWGDFGWNDRGDWFYNEGTQCSVTIYQHRDYGGYAVTIPRYSTATWSNIVSSNRWC